MDGLKAEVCYNSEAAFEKIKNGNFSLIISDLNLGGNFITDKILLQAKQKNPNQKVALMSGGDIRQDHRITEFLKQYPDALLLSKPFEMKIILDLFEDI